LGDLNQKTGIEWRGSKVLELSSQGNNQIEISRILQVPTSTINRDVLYLREQSKQNIKKYIDERLSEEYEKCQVGLTSILKEAWYTAKTAEDKREKIQALSLAKECYAMRLDLLTNATVVDDAIRFVSEKTSALKSKSKEDQDAKEAVTNQVF
jgi:hypothetical protein